MLGLKLTLQSQIILYPLSIQKDKKNYIVEEPVSGDFFEMPKICIDAIDRINEGQTLGDIEIELREKYPNEKVDMIEFGGQLIELGLVQKLDGEKMTQKKKLKLQVDLHGSPLLLDVSFSMELRIRFISFFY